MGQESDQMTNREGWYTRPEDPADPGAVRGDARFDASADDDTAEIRAEIEQTRAEMSRTIDAIQERLDPEHLKEQAVEQIKEQFDEAKATVREATIGKVEDMVQSAGHTVSRAGNSIIDTISENPLPVALIGIGLGMLLYNGRSTPRRPARYDSRGRYLAGAAYGGAYGRTLGRGGYGREDESLLERGQEAIGDAADSAQEAARDIARSAKQTASDVVDQGRDAANYLADQAQEQMEWAGDTFHHAIRTNPLAVGAVALALGAVAGAILPHTEAENELMGEARDNLLHNAQEVAEDAIDRVQHVAGRVAERAQRAVKEEVRSPQNRPAH